MRKRPMSLADVHKLLQQEVDRAGSQSAWARQFGFDTSLVSKAITVVRRPTTGVESAQAEKGRDVPAGRVSLPYSCRSRRLRSKLQSHSALRFRSFFGPWRRYGAMPLNGRAHS